MDELRLEEDFRDEVRQVIREHGVELEEAMLIVALRRGQVYGAGDIVSLHPLSAEQLRRLGLDHDPEQVIAESRARLAKKAAQSSLETDGNRAAVPAKRSAGRRS